MNKIPHYYGDTVRGLFFSGGVIMVLTLPFFKEITNINIFIPIFIMLVLAFAAGLTNPQSRWSIIMDTIVSGFAFIAFEYCAVTKFYDLTDSFFWTNQILAILFFLAFYYSIKTWRGSSWFLN